ncbi:hypothetical protein INT48_006943 [Thamnidium elegans]|uniref:Uncharacterized protein n=1 Tax=Thamnidium elegans TaxID=101142 RepID=A0A8H7STN0_9FUNG|nr:hypothetical protein INT48_006943 [Thamnidium elegans]
MESLVKEASKELESRLSIDTVASDTISTFNTETQACINRVNETSELTTKIQTETELINQMLSSLKEKHQELESTFKNIDQLEILVNKVKDTYNAVAENVDYIEKAVSASTRQGKRSDIPVQPYFPPPRPVEIYNSCVKA